MTLKMRHVVVSQLLKAIIITRWDVTVRRSSVGSVPVGKGEAGGGTPRGGDRQVTSRMRDYDSTWR